MSRTEVLRGILGPLFSASLRLETEGESNVPVQGPCVLVFNHLSNLDPPLLFTRMPRSDATGLVAASYRSRPFHRWIVEAGGGLWLRRGEGDRATLMAALHQLDQGWLVGLAPEGGRSPTGVMRAGQPGAAFLALRSGAPVVPVGLDGTDRVLPSLARGQRATVTIQMGPAFHPHIPPEVTARRRRLDLATEQIMAAIARLVPPWRRGLWGSP